MPSSLAVRLAPRGATLSTSGSPNIRLGQVMVAHRNRRTWTRRWTARPCEGGSIKRRSYRLWTCPDRRPHSGQAASGAVGRAMINSRSGSVVTPSINEPAGEIAWNEPRRMAALPNLARRIYQACTESDSEPLFHAYSHGMRIVRAVVAGERDAATLAALRDRRCRGSAETNRARVRTLYPARRDVILSGSEVPHFRLGPAVSRANAPHRAVFRSPPAGSRV